VVYSDEIRSFDRYSSHRGNYFLTISTSVVSNPIFSRMGRILNWWFPCSSITPFLYEPPQASLLLSCVARSLRSNSFSSRPLTIVYSLPHFRRSIIIFRRVDSFETSSHIQRSSESPHVLHVSSASSNMINHYLCVEFSGSVPRFQSVRYVIIGILHLKY